MPLDNVGFSGSQIVEDLREAKRVLEEKTWVQNQSFVRSDEGLVLGVCAIGALLYAIYGSNLPKQLDNRFMAAENWLQRSLPIEERHGVGSWNDHPDRTKSEVIALFERSLLIASGQELALPGM
jgi:hypothetical protein